MRRWLKAVLLAIGIGLLIGFAIVDLSYDFPVREREPAEVCLPPMRCPP